MQRILLFASDNPAAEPPTPAKDAFCVDADNPAITDATDGPIGYDRATVFVAVMVKLVLRVC